MVLGMQKNVHRCWLLYGIVAIQGFIFILWGLGLGYRWRIRVG